MRNLKGPSLLREDPFSISLLCRAEPTLHFLCGRQIYQIQNRLYHLMANADNILTILLHAVLHFQIILMGFLNKAADCLRRLKLFLVNPVAKGLTTLYVFPKTEFQFFLIHAMIFQIAASWEPTQEGTGDPSPDNIRPIKGRNSVSFSRYGCNIITTPYRDKSKSENGVQFTVNDDGSVSIKGTATEITYFNLCINKTLRKFVDKGVYSALDVPKKVWIFTVSGCTMQARDNDVTMYIAVAKDRTIDKTVYPIVLVGSTVPEIVPGPSEYNTTTLTLPDTIYGGAVDAATGEGEILYNIANIPIEKLAYNSSISAMLGFASANLLPGVKLPASVNGLLDGLCDCLPIQSASAINSGTVGFGITPSGDVYLRAGKLESAQAYAEKFPDGVNVCYKLKAPVNFQASSSQVISAISGINTILTDADSVTVTARKDPVRLLAGLES